MIITLRANAMTGLQVAMEHHLPTAWEEIKSRGVEETLARDPKPGQRRSLPVEEEPWKCKGSLGWDNPNSRLVGPVVIFTG